MSRNFDITQVYSKLCPTTMMGHFAKIVHNKPLTIFAKCSILDVWQGSEHASATQHLTIIANINHLNVFPHKDFEKKRE